jgi:hypothetical protein
MKKKKLHITEKCDENPTGWYLSFERPEFQGGGTIKIDKQTATTLLKDIRRTRT